jgi:alpha-glucosidase
VAMRQDTRMKARGLSSTLFGCCCIALCIFLSPFYPAESRAQENPASIKALANGIELRKGNTILQIVALRDDVLRVREALDGALPEDASWAVAESIRKQSVAVVPQGGSPAAGFQTKSLRVAIEPNQFVLTVSDLQGHVLQEDAIGWPAESHGAGFRIYKKMPIDEHYFGLGDKIGPLDRREQSFRLWNTDSFGFQESTDPIYKSIPFFISEREGRYLGVLLDNTWSTNFDFGRGQRNLVSIAAEGGPIDYYLLFGPEPKDVVQTYAWLTGLPPLPPLWSLGFQQSRFSYETEKRLREIAARLRADKIPSDVLYLDIDFQQDNRPFTVNKERFPHFQQMLEDLKKEDFHVVVITDLHIAHLPNAGYSPYDTGTAQDRFVKNPDGSVFIGSVWPGPAVFPDFTQQQTRAWFGGLYKDFYTGGVSGFWNDMNEPSVFLTPLHTMPGDARHRIDEPGFRSRTATHLEIHNVYGMENSRATYDGLIKLNPDLRPFVLTRATYAGGQRYAVTWTGDNTSSWNHLRLATPMLLNLGLSGFGLCGADVGGFIGTPRPELLTLWTELATFQPIDRNHTNKGAGDKEVWVHGPEQEAIRRRYIEERYRLMPYLYTTVEELTRTGLPVVRPVFLEFPHATPDSHPIDLDAGNEFMFGPDILVAPPPFPEQPDKYELKLPPGVWYDYWTGEKIQPPVAADKNSAPGGVFINPQLEKLPVYVREGGIIPMQPVTQSTSETPSGPLTVRIYPGKDCHGSLYQDDGKSFAFKRGEFLRIDFSCAMTASGVSFHKVERHRSFQPWWKQIHLEVYGWDAPKATATWTGNSDAPRTTVDTTRHVVSIELPDNGQSADLEVRKSN